MTISTMKTGLKMIKMKMTMKKITTDQNYKLKMGTAKNHHCQCLIRVRSTLDKEVSMTLSTVNERHLRELKKQV